VGSIVLVGYAKGNGENENQEEQGEGVIKQSSKSVDWSLFRNIFLAWIITLPACIGLSAAFMFILRLIFL
jgi:phosphate/sulfate permease